MNNLRSLAHKFPDSVNIPCNKFSRETHGRVIISFLTISSFTDLSFPLPQWLYKRLRVVFDFILTRTCLSFNISSLPPWQPSWVSKKKLHVLAHHLHHCIRWWSVVFEISHQKSSNNKFMLIVTTLMARGCVSKCYAICQLVLMRRYKFFNALLSVTFSTKH